MIGIIGAGAFGSGLGLALAAAGHKVLIWGRDEAHISGIRQSGENARYLPGRRFGEKISVTSNLNDLNTASTILASVPLQSVRTVLAQLTVPHATPIVACCKGIELDTGLGPVSIINELRPDAPAALLTGPSFASDIADGKPTALTLACADTKTGAALQEQLSTQTLRLYLSTDTRGAEIGGALKNVMAIACGAVMGAGLGDSARAAIMTRGFAEMHRVNAAMGGQPETLAGLSGLGDLALTCTSDLSRNYRLGLALGQNQSFDAHVTVEGAATARAMMRLAGTHNLDLPITRIVTQLVDGHLKIHDAIAALMSRPLKEE